MCDRSINERGNLVIRKHSIYEDRYTYDFKICTPDKGWEQFDTDQDAWYFGVWVNRERLMTVTYAEGDEVVVLCKDAEHYNAELKDACEFYGEGTLAIAIDEQGTTVYRQDRAQFFIEEDKS